MPAVVQHNLEQHKQGEHDHEYLMDALFQNGLFPLIIMSFPPLLPGMIWLNVVSTITANSEMCDIITQHLHRLLINNAVKLCMLRIFPR